MSRSPVQRGPASAPDAVVQSLVDGWNRMVWLLFKGPHASLVNWLWWGVILLLAGVLSGGGGGNGGTSIDTDTLETLGWDTSGTTWLSAGLITLVVAAACVAVVLAVIFIYIRSRFRFILVDGVLSGAPNIKEPWSRTPEVGLQYFIWEILINLGCLLLALPVVLMWLPVIRDALGGGHISGGEVAWRLVISIPWIILLAIAKSVVDWFVYDLALPLTWCRTGNFWSGLKSAGELARGQVGAVLLFLIGRIIVGIGGAIASLVIVCCTFWIWMLPLVPIVALAVLSGAFPPLLVLTAPLILALVLVVLWIIATLSAPIFLFYRSWSVAFLQRLDPDFRGWNGGDEPGSAPPLDDPPVADASSSSASSWSEPEPPSPGADERPDGLPPEDPR